jgi:MerR family mercuric resistance operon transcriptional regulator
MRRADAQVTIGGLARAADVGVETIRYYQRRGLLPEPQRPPGQVRRYGPREMQRLEFIRAAQQLGFSLDEVASLLTLEDGAHCVQAREIAAHKLAIVRDRLDALRRMEAALAELVASCEQHTGDIACPLIAALGSRNPC